MIGLGWWSRCRAVARTFGEYIGGMRGRAHREPVDDTESLRRFLEGNANLVAQTSLYGYLRTRAGLRYPTLFTDDVFVRSINVAKWHVWLDCLADLAVYAGGLIARRGGADPASAGVLVRDVVDAILQAVARPDDADDTFEVHAAEVRRRLEAVDWSAVPDDETAFAASPGALVRWAPIVDELKQLDEEIVRNSVRFRWQEVRRALRTRLRADALIAEAVSPRANRPSAR
ncbi:MAG: esterase [Ectothiorhodospiraceae bacterium]|nr:esterase [Chromatiales bacterium]MCP5154353.1 esterase [Ectothiorhodospiraceae bacterium]